MGALLYALKARQAEGHSIEDELLTRLDQLPAHLRDQVASGIYARIRKLGIRGPLKAEQDAAANP
jgi:hypothetical protein